MAHWGKKKIVHRGVIVEVLAFIRALIPIDLIRVACIGALLNPLVTLWSQNGIASPSQTGLNVLTLEQCLSAALSKSDSIAILQKNLNISRAQYKQTVAANSVSLNGSLGGGGHRRDRQHNASLRGSWHGGDFCRLHDGYSAELLGLSFPEWPINEPEPRGRGILFACREHAVQRQQRSVSA